VAFESQEPQPPLTRRSRALATVTERLLRAGVVLPEREAEWLLLHALGISRAALWAEPGAALSGREAAMLEELVVRRERREPLQLILGSVPFHDITIEVEPGAFVSRPETEELVEAVLDAVRTARSVVEQRPRTAPAGMFLDWGTGTGAIAIALLRALPGWTGIAADRSPRALALAARNAARNGVAARLRVVQADFSDPRQGPVGVPGPFDLLVSNPPYVRGADVDGLEPEVKGHDPREALDGGLDGLDAYRHLARGLRTWLRPGGHLALEIGSDQADDVLRLFGADVVEARVLPDRAGHPRILMGTMRGGEP
jgi:release factor glutamine methyltransferase